MTQTGQVRNIDTWRSAVLPNLNVLKPLPVEDLYMKTFNQANADVFSQCSDDLFPDLKRIGLEVSDEKQAARLSPLLKFASRRPIDRVQFFVSTRDVEFSWAEESVRALGAMSHLRCLHLSSEKTSQFKDDDLTPFLPAGCWPTLAEVIFEWPTMTEKQLQPLLAACPNADNVEIVADKTVLGEGLILAMTLFHCPRALRVSLISLGARETIDRAEDAWTRYPFPAEGHGIACLQARLFPTSVVSFHLAVTYLKRCPHLV